MIQFLHFPSEFQLWSRALSISPLTELEMGFSQLFIVSFLLPFPNIPQPQRTTQPRTFKYPASNIPIPVMPFSPGFPSILDSKPPTWMVLYSTVFFLIESRLSTYQYPRRHSDFPYTHTAQLHAHAHTRTHTNTTRRSFPQCPTSSPRSSSNPSSSSFTWRKNT